MDSTAVNYDSDATFNSNTWCISPVAGCMMPPATAEQACALAPTSGHCRDRAGANYNPIATVDEGCVAARLGCTSSTALNYDPFATLDFDCYEPKTGCLDRRALNFGCAAPSTTTCDDKVSIHNSFACTFFYQPPSSPPGPWSPPGAYTEIYVVRATLVVEGSVSDWDDDRRTNLRQRFATLAGVDLSAVALVVTAASVVLDVTITANSQAAQSSILSTLQAQLASVEAASALLGVNALSVPLVYGEVITVAIQPPPSAPPDSTEFAIYTALVFTGVVLSIALPLGYWYFKFWVPARPWEVKVTPFEPTSSTTGIGIEGDHDHGGGIVPSPPLKPISREYPAQQT